MKELPFLLRVSSFDHLDLLYYSYFIHFYSCSFNFLMKATIEFPCPGQKSFIVLCCVVLCCVVLCCVVLCCVVLYCTVLYCTELYCTVLYCTVLYCTVLYCTVLYDYKMQKAYDKRHWLSLVLLPPSQSLHFH